MLATVGRGRHPIADTPSVAQVWAAMPCVSGRGEPFMEMKGKTLIECLERICEEIRAGRLEEEISLSLDLTGEDATLNFLERNGGEHLFFDYSGVKVSYQRRTEEVIDGHYLRDLAFGTLGERNTKAATGGAPLPNDT
ncbi:hypothetical protein [Salipiger sp. PrR003]|uniref:hypothetical protein n=1 Tax=Salipiger sp. PrR003 TaxID=2706776 RepID=UPI0013DBE52B|nr:hypothetical protein [Salipiger sp. PrR003]NDV52153.1 hypothetical protein [Salipiger sp. PrR003]NDV52179.1 hypothetical protein [Salipiger sp. PrR003]